MLKVERIEKSFGGLRVVDDCSLLVNAGEIVGLIGPNGAGKTTLFNFDAIRLEPDVPEPLTRLAGHPDQEVLDNRQILEEQRHLERSDQAAPRDPMRGPAGDLVIF